MSHLWHSFWGWMLIRCSCPAKWQWSKHTLSRSLSQVNTYVLEMCAPCGLLYPMQTAFPSVYQLFASAATFGASSATCEASFSTLSRVLMAYRRSMTHERKRNLVILAFLRSYTKNVNMEDVLRGFSKNSRKLQLF